ncbi:hypothetical protein [Corynebacterium cystitidis]|uniref:hypothetical protein n=1 Tax=Corynebacterium cystitidis TaxID=35757 RepID=UPI00211DF6E2|nr:hypothetical protein [Corynebacterium cystitidis]
MGNRSGKAAMNIQAITEHLSSQDGLGIVEQARADDQSTTFYATNSWGTDAAEIEVFLSACF